jgi:hypothetical protein
VDPVVRQRGRVEWAMLLIPTAAAQTVLSELPRDRRSV